MAYARAWNETLDSAQQPRATSQILWQQISTASMALAEKQAKLNARIVETGVTFTTYQDGMSLDRPWPCDVIPRVIAASEWQNISAGLQQRLRALNAFIDDVYHAQKIFAAGIVPRDLLDTSVHFRPECVGISPPEGLWAHISGCDLVRDANGQWLVLEDNLRVPSGVSYMLENRRLLAETAPEWFSAQSEANQKILQNNGYVPALKQLCVDLAHANAQKHRTELETMTIVVLTPGVLNSAYFEHAYLAKHLGAVLAEGQDLFVDANDVVWLKSTPTPCRVDVIYRRIDDAFLDPEVFRKDSTLGVPGLMRAWTAGKVALLNAPGAGVADDKVVYAYVPKMIEFYLGETPILPNVPTYLCHEPENLAFVLENIEKLVVKPANESGGYGILIGPRSTAEECAQFKQSIVENPRHYIAQPTLDLSCAPTLTAKGIAPRHLDLRPFVLGATASQPQGYVTVGGLTRVALQENSLVVNSSQGGGSKDTWIIGDGLNHPPRLQPISPTPLKTPLPARHLEFAYWWGRYAARLLALRKNAAESVTILELLRYNLRGLRGVLPEIVWETCILMNAEASNLLPLSPQNAVNIWRNIWTNQGLLGLMAHIGYELEQWDAAARAVWTSHVNLQSSRLVVSALYNVHHFGAKITMPTKPCLSDSPQLIVKKCADWHEKLAAMWV